MTARQNIFDLTQKVVVVTGAAGQLGGAYTRALLSAGARVAALDLNVDNPRGNLGSLKDKNLLITKADITKRKNLEAVLRKIEAKWKAPDGLVNNAAIDVPPGTQDPMVSGPFESYPEGVLQEMLDVNVKGAVLCCQVFGGAMAGQKAGSIVNISSIYGMVSPDQRLYAYKKEPFFKPVGYSVTKSALFNLTRYLAVYWASANVRVNTMTLAGVFNRQDEAFLKNYCKKVPLGRMAEPDDFTGGLVYLLSDASRYMTGANLVIDGGYTSL